MAADDDTSAAAALQRLSAARSEDYAEFVQSFAGRADGSNPLWQRTLPPTATVAATASRQVEVAPLSLYNRPGRLLLVGLNPIQQQQQQQQQ